jgi:type VI secretion system secreted protein VgrG
MPAAYARLLCDAFPEGFRTLTAAGTEAVSKLSRWDVRVVCDDPAVDLAAALGQPATLQLVDELEGTARVIPLLVEAAAYEDESRDGHRYAVTLAAREELLGLRGGYRTWMDKTAPEIVAEVLHDAGIPDADVELRLATGYAPRPMTTQYGESDWRFIERLLAEEGIAYWLDVDDAGEAAKLVFGDAPAAHDGVRGAGTMAYRDPGDGAPGRRFFDLEVTGLLVPTQVTVRDFDVRAPDVPIEGVAGVAGFEVFEFPANVVSSEAAALRATARLEQLGRLAQHAIGLSDCVRLQPGRVVTIEGASDDWMNGAYLVAGLEHEITMGSARDPAASSYANRALLVPHGKRPFRPAPPSPVRVHGLEPATTTGAAGQEIHVDDLARVKIRFPWDRSGRTDDTSSAWVRTQQMNLGGAMILPRVGWEVPVVYLDGNPDRPIVLGRLYNATAVVPYGLPGASATTSFQSATSPGGGTTNELRMGDSAGGMEMFLHAQKDQTVTVGGSADTTVGADDTHDVTLSYGVAIKGSQTTTVGASQSVNVGTIYGTTAKGARSETVAALEATKVGANRVVAAGGSYSELVGGLYGIQCNQSNTEVKATFTQLIGGSLNLAAGLGTGETVAGARTELVGASRSITASRDASESVIGAKNLTAGATKETSGGAVQTTTKVAGKISVGGAAKLTSGGVFIIEAASITIDVGGSLKAPGFQLGGGVFKIKKGTSKLKGSVKHGATSKIGG